VHVLLKLTRLTLVSSILRLIPLVQSEGNDAFLYYMLGVDYVLTDLEMLMFAIGASVTGVCFINFAIIPPPSNKLTL
jgi:hypothetical protein